jgi:hypothetical protein
MAVDVATPNYDVSADGRRVLVIEPGPEPSPMPLVVVQNWFAELRQKMGQ